MSKQNPIQFFQIDAFADQAFAGNPAAVCLMDGPASDSWLNSVGAEMNLSETAFVWQAENGFQLRWFTPTVEVDLCGHATLAAAHALWESGWLAKDQDANFQTRSGLLTARLVTKTDGNTIWLDFPAKPQSSATTPNGLLESLGVQAVHVGRNDFDILVEVKTEDEVCRANPNFQTLLDIECRGVILTAASDREGCDFVSRFFCPAVGINEDPVTGSAHVCLAPYWLEKLGGASPKNNELIGYQASTRGGWVKTRFEGDRVALGGTAVTVIRGELDIRPSVSQASSDYPSTGN